jgi:Cysteine-rich secretory protein family
VSLQGYPENVTYSKSASSWYNEEKLYNYNDPGAVDFHKIGHFTQMVWKSTSQLGCGRALCSAATSPFNGNGAKGEWVYVVCRYKAPGNVMSFSGDTWSYFKENVLPPGRQAREIKTDI